jgi:DNA-binding CsgD family transcriptional regulator
MSDNLTASQRGDMVETLMPEAAGLVVDVHEGSADDIKARLAGLSRHELEAVAVVLAALADPDRGLVEALAWVDFDENGRPLERDWRSERSVRDHVPQGRRELAGVDVVAVHRAVAPDNFGRVALTREERRLAIQVGKRRGLQNKEIAERLGMTPEAVDRSWERMKERERAAVREAVEVPEMAVVA